jgi:hypothetical protein
MATNQFNGINFDTNITAIDNNVFKDSESLGSNGNISSIRFANLTSVGDSAFANCYSLEEITLGNNQNISIGISAFQNCKSLYRVIMDSTAKLKAIGTTAFGGCSQLISRNQFIITNENLNGIGT